MPAHGESVTADERGAAQHRRAPGHRWWIWIAVLVVVVGGAALVARRYARAHSKAAAPTSPPALAVSTVPASRGDIGVHLDALGTVTPLATVTVKTRVNGQLMSVNYREGQMVRQGDVLAEIDPRPYQAMLLQAEGQYRRDLALLKGARVDLVRYRNLYARDAIQKQQLDDQLATVQQYEGTVKYDEGQVESAKVNLVYCRITSPVAGRVGLRLVDPGNIVQTTDTTGLVMITQLQPMTVVFSVAEDFLPEIQDQIRLGNKLQVVALDRAQQRQIASGELLTVDNQIDTTTGTVKLKAIFPNDDLALFPNQFVNAQLLVDVHRGATLVPAAAIQRNAQGAFVYLAKPDQTVSMQPVSVGTTDADETEILKGLQPGDVIATDNFDKLQDGMRISPHRTVAEARGGSMR
jgi:multidrug efflux system membrane fusion protein